MRESFLLITLLFSNVLFAKCPETISSKTKSIIINFDGLGASEFGLKILERHVSKEIKSSCLNQEVLSLTFHYTKRGASNAIECVKVLQKTTPSQISINTFGHSFGGGKGVMNFIYEAKNQNIQIENVVTFDPRGYSYRYTNPGAPLVKNFVNIYQRYPLKGMQVQNADFEKDVTGETNHGDIPKDFKEMAIENLIGHLSCAQ